LRISKDSKFYLERGVKFMYSYILRNLITLYDFVTQTPTRRFLSELERSQWFTPEKIRELQEKKLRYLLNYAYHNVQYYHKIFRTNNLYPDDIHTLKDLTKLPILRRTDVKAEFNTLISKNYPKEKTVYGRTGGSTGVPIKFYTTKENRAWSVAARYLAWRWAGFEMGDKFAYVFGSPLDKPVFQSLWGKLEGKIKRRISLDAYLMSRNDMENFVKKLKKFKPKVIYGFASAVANLAKFIEERSIKNIHPHAVIIDSMRLLDYEVKMIEKSFGCRVWWNYHNRENGTFAAECSEHEGYHLFAQNFVFEFIRDGEPVTPGEIGSIVVTDLTNYAMPFLRYEIGDMGIASSEKCPCGRGLPLMKKLLGRTSELLLSANGEFVFDPFYGRFEPYFFEKRKIKQYQFIQESPTKLMVNIVPDTDFKHEDKELIKKLVSSIMGNIEIEIKLVDNISLSPSGKLQRAIRKFEARIT
jgi:phenylacetate-CoA ligase